MRTRIRERDWGGVSTVGGSRKALARCGRSRAGLRLRFGDVEAQFSVGGHNLNTVARLDVSTQQFLRQRVLEITPNCATHRPCAIVRIVAFLDEEVRRARVQLDMSGFRLDA